jgi:two-component system, chemotaxis family, protein-glutamate methylesterase/glutaminase
MQGRVIVMGASANGIEALGQILGGLPASFAAPVFIVEHVARNSPGQLPAILGRAGPLPVMHPRDGQRIVPGIVCVAPPDRHMLLRNGTVQLSGGPEENFCRPAVDVLFRSAAVAYGASVVGVVLTGYLSDGTVGLVAIKDRGGVAVIQDPKQAAASSMPQSAMANMHVDYVLPIDKIAPVLEALVADPNHLVPLIELEDRIAGGEATPDDRRRMLVASTPTDRACPVCHRPMFQLPERRFRRYRCASGHAFTTPSLDRDIGADPGVN